jgi:tetratricopeptide (TPR) repeat protein
MRSGAGGAATSGDGAESQRQRARLLGDWGRHAEAIELLNAALARYPDHHRLLCELSVQQNQSGDRRSALQNASRAVAAAPNRYWPHQLRCDLLRTSGHLGDALEAGLRAVAIAPESPITLYSLGMVYIGMRSKVRAAECLATMERAAPEHQNTLDMAVQLAFLRKDHFEAERVCRRAITLFPESFLFFNNLGVALQRQRRTGEAVAAYREAVRLCGSNAVARKNLLRSAPEIIAQLFEEQDRAAAQA